MSMVRLLCENPFVVRIRAMQGVMVHHGGYITQHSTRIQCVVVSEMIL